MQTTLQVNPTTFSSSSSVDRTSAPSASTTVVSGRASWGEPNVAFVKATRLSRRTAEERDVQGRIAVNFQRKLATDHATVHNPDTTTPFLDYEDAVKRLLPYHIFQQPWEDVYAIEQFPFHQSKFKARPEDRRELADTKFALECFRRRRKLNQRFVETLTRSGRRLAPDDQAYFLAHETLQIERQDHASLNSQYRAARSELDQIERLKKQQVQASSSTTTPQSSQGSGSFHTFSVPYHGQPPRGVPSYPTSSTAPLQLYPPAAPAAPPTSTVTEVLIPVSSLPSFHAIGIVPVPMGSAQVEGAPPPAALITATSSTTLTVQINLSVLQSNQTAALGVLLKNIYVARTAAATQAQKQQTPQSAPS